MCARLNTRGATLPLTIRVIVLLGVSVGIASLRLSSERRITGDAEAQLNAFAVAQSGLSRYMSLVSAKPAASPADITYNDLPGGTAVVTVRMLRDSTTTLLPAVYIVTSRGTNTTAKRYSSGSAPAERTTATYALWTPAPFDVNGAITSLTAVAITGSSASLSGIDRCGAAGTTAGVAVPNDQFTANHPEIVDGVPDDDERDLGTPGAGGGADQEVKIDWNGIRNGGLMPADYTWPAWPTAGAQMDAWPVTRVDNDGGADFVLPAGNGKGILIVTGNLRINGTTPPWTWEGLILIGGRLVLNGNTNIYGAVVSGLNVKLGQVALDSDLGSGTKIIRYDSCSLTRALGHIGSLQRVRNGWTDSWASY
jgi:hypothetical protein